MHVLERKAGKGLDSTAALLPNKLFLEVCAFVLSSVSPVCFLLWMWASRENGGSAWEMQKPSRVDISTLESPSGTMVVFLCTETLEKWGP